MTDPTSPFATPDPSAFTPEDLEGDVDTQQGDTPVPEPEEGSSPQAPSPVPEPKLHGVIFIPASEVADPDTRGRAIELEIDRLRQNLMDACIAHFGR